MWDSVEAILKYGSAAAITAAALVMQQIRADGRDDRRRKENRDERERDRAAAREEAEAQRLAALRERWRDDRLGAYSSLYAVVDRASNMATQHTGFIKRPGSKPPEYDPINKAWRQLIDETNEPYARVSMVASTKTDQAANNLLMAFLGVAASVMAIVNEAHLHEDDREEGQAEEIAVKADKFREVLSNRMDEFLDSARLDLETP